MKPPLALVLITAIWHITKPALGQSTFLLSNFLGTGSLDAPVFDAAGNRLSGTNYVATLYGGSAADMLKAATVPPSPTSLKAPVPFTYMPAGTAGYFSGGPAQVPTDVCGSVAWLQVRAWDARLGATYEDVVRLGIGGYGESNLFQDRGGDPCGLPSPPAPLFGLQPFSLLPEVPEPSPFALLLLCLPLLLLPRLRRNRAVHLTRGRVREG